MIYVHCIYVYTYIVLYSGTLPSAVYPAEYVPILIYNRSSSSIEVISPMILL